MMGEDEPFTLADGFIWVYRGSGLWFSQAFFDWEVAIHYALARRHATGVKQRVNYRPQFNDWIVQPA